MQMRRLLERYAHITRYRGWVAASAIVCDTSAVAFSAIRCIDNRFQVITVTSGRPLPGPHCHAALPLHCYTKHITRYRVWVAAIAIVCDTKVVASSAIRCSDNMFQVITVTSDRPLPGPHCLTALPLHWYSTHTQDCVDDRICHCVRYQGCSFFLD